MRVRRLVSACVAMVCLWGATGCERLSDLSFRTDHRLHFLTPKDRATTRLPVRLSWTMRAFTVAREGSAPPSRKSGYFAIFVDRAPIKPDQTMRAVASGDPFCEHERGCPDTAYLKQHQVYTTTHTSLVLREVQPLANSHSKEQVHEATIVLMDTAGHRIGESNWYVDFKLPKSEFS